MAHSEDDNLELSLPSELAQYLSLGRDGDRPVRIDASDGGQALAVMRGSGLYPQHVATLAESLDAPVDGVCELSMPWCLAASSLLDHIADTALPVAGRAEKLAAVFWAGHARAVAAGRPPR
jgi:hypothetical protein